MDNHESATMKRFRLSKFQIIGIIVSAALFVVFASLLFYKDDNTIEDCAVSPDEQDIVLVQRSAPWKKEQTIRLVCFHSNGQIVFDTDITDFTAGGTCAVWFEKGEIVVYFFRKRYCRCYSTEGEFLQEYSYEGKWSPRQFQQFKAGWWKRVYKGKTFDLQYNNKGLIGYYALNKPKTLTLIHSDGNTYTLWIAYSSDN